MSLFLLPDLSRIQFEKISTTIRRITGISLRDGKESLVKSRLLKRMRTLEISSFAAYLAFLETDRSGNELQLMIDALTTNKTSFFRESAHFDFLRHNLPPEWRNRELRIWSAGCSTGEEPFSIAITLADAGFKAAPRILATDISTEVLDTARSATYSTSALAQVPHKIRESHFAQVTSGDEFRAVESIRSRVRFAKLNLMETWPMSGPFDAIFCRNVMIYFDRDTQEKIVRRFAALLSAGGYLFVGHSESVGSATPDIRYVQPAIYVKKSKTELRGEE